MEVQTPSYWQEEIYQPLVEVETAYGNKVKIPESLLDTWKKWEELKGKYPHNVEQAKAAGWFEQKGRPREKGDIRRVYYEQYHE